MISTRYYLHSKVSKKGTQSLYLDVHCDGAIRLRQAVGETLKASEWNQKKEVVNTRHEYADTINARLERLTLKVQQTFREMLDEGRRPTGEDLRQLLRPLRETRKEQRAHTATELLQRWIDTYTERRGFGGNVNKDNHARKFRQVITHLEKFKPGVLPQDLTEKLWNNYLEYLYEEAGVEDGTVGKHLQGWKNILKEVGLPHDMAWLRNTYNREKLKHDLSWKEVQLLYAHPYTDARHQEAADAFLFACQTGLRRGDLESVKHIHVLEVETPQFGTVLCIRKRQGKTGQPVLVPLPPMAREIYDRYKGVPPIQTNYNALLKRAAKEAGLKRQVTLEVIKNGHVTETQAPLHQAITSHMARHTAATRIREAADMELAGLLLGHGNKTNTARYAHLDLVRTAERILTAWTYYEQPAGR
jgi:integrase